MVTQTKEKSTQTTAALSPIYEEEEDHGNTFKDEAETIYLISGMVAGTAIALITVVCAGYVAKTWRNRWQTSL